MKLIKIKIWIIALIAIVCSIVFFFVGYFVGKTTNGDTGDSDNYHSEYAGMWQATTSSGEKREMYLQRNGSCLRPDSGTGYGSCWWKQEGDYIIAEGKEVLMSYNTESQCDEAKEVDDSKYEYRDVDDNSGLKCVVLRLFERKYTILDDGSLFYNNQLTYRRIKTY